MLVNFVLLCMMGKFILADNILKYFALLSHNIGFDISCKLSQTIYMNCHSLFYGKYKKSIKYWFAICWISLKSGKV